MANKLLEDTEEQRISHCRDHKGEEESPYKHGIEATWDERCTFWAYEEYYANGYDNLDGEYAEYKRNGGKSFAGIPEKLLSMMVYFYFKYGGTYDEDFNGFYKEVEKYLSLAADRYPVDKIPNSD